MLPLTLSRQGSDSLSRCFYSRDETYARMAFNPIMIYTRRLVKLYKTHRNNKYTPDVAQDALDSGDLIRVSAAGGLPRIAESVKGPIDLSNDVRCASGGVLVGCIVYATR